MLFPDTKGGFVFSKDTYKKTSSASPLFSVDCEMVRMKLSLSRYICVTLVKKVHFYSKTSMTWSLVTFS